MFAGRHVQQLRRKAAFDEFQAVRKPTKLHSFLVNQLKETYEPSHVENRRENARLQETESANIHKRDAYKQSLMQILKGLVIEVNSFLGTQLSRCLPPPEDGNR
jgi:hypothetical protein